LNSEYRKYESKYSDSESPTTDINILPGAINSKDIRRTWVRFLMLFMACCFIVGSYFSFD
jgi:hypothetical protein